MWTFSVQDNGAGIEEQFLGSIFQPFQTLSTLSGSASSGLGLSIVKKIIETYDGSLSVESVPGEGSTFSFSLPKRLGRLDG